jgi:hypothetical protein
MPYSGSVLRSLKLVHLACVISPLSSVLPQRFHDPGGAFETRARAECRNRRSAPRDQGAPRRACALNAYRVDFFD